MKPYLYTNMEAVQRRGDSFANTDILNFTDSKSLPNEHIKPKKFVL